MLPTSDVVVAAVAVCAVCVLAGFVLCVRRCLRNRRSKTDTHTQRNRIGLSAPLLPTDSDGSVHSHSHSLGLSFSPSTASVHTQNVLPFLSVPLDDTIDSADRQRSVLWQEEDVVLLPLTRQSFESLVARDLITDAGDGHADPFVVRAVIAELKHSGQPCLLRSGIRWVSLPAHVRHDVWDALLSLYTPVDMSQSPAFITRSAPVSVRPTRLFESPQPPTPSSAGSGRTSPVSTTYPTTTTTTDSDSEVDLASLPASHITAANAGVQLTSRQPLSDLISIDVPRCKFLKFRSPPWSDRLEQLLRTWDTHAVECQYSQALNSMAAVVLHVYAGAVGMGPGSGLSFRGFDSRPPAAAFQRIIDIYQSGMLSAGALNKVAEVRRLSQFLQVLAFWDPVLAVHMCDTGLDVELYAIPWLTTMFADSTNMHTTTRIWDVALVLDARFPLFLATAILSSARTELLQASSLTDGLMALSAVKEGNQVVYGRCVRRAVQMWAASPSTLGSVDYGPIGTQLAKVSDVASSMHTSAAGSGVGGDVGGGGGGGVGGGGGGDVGSGGGSSFISDTPTGLGGRQLLTPSARRASDSDRVALLADMLATNDEGGPLEHATSAPVIHASDPTPPASASAPAPAPPPPPPSSFSVLRQHNPSSGLSISTESELATVSELAAGSSESDGHVAPTSRQIVIGDGVGVFESPGWTSPPNPAGSQSSNHTPTASSVRSTPTLSRSRFSSDRFNGPFATPTSTANAAVVVAGLFAADQTAAFEEKHGLGETKPVDLLSPPPPLRTHRQHRARSTHNPSHSRPKLSDADGVGAGDSGDSGVSEDRLLRYQDAILSRDVLANEALPVVRLQDLADLPPMSSCVVDIRRCSAAAHASFASIVSRVAPGVTVLHCPASALGLPQRSIPRPSWLKRRRRGLSSAPGIGGIGGLVSRPSADTDTDSVVDDALSHALKYRWTGGLDVEQLNDAVGGTAGTHIAAFAIESSLRLRRYVTFSPLTSQPKIAAYVKRKAAHLHANKGKVLALYTARVADLALVRDILVRAGLPGVCSLSHAFVLPDRDATPTIAGSANLI